MKKSPFWMLFGEGLRQVFCKHKGPHDEWFYRMGSGVTDLHCCRCGKTIRKVALDDLPKGELSEVIKILREKNREED